LGRARNQQGADLRVALFGGADFGCAAQYDDEMIVALGKKRGVVQINLDCGYLNPAVATG